MLLLFKFIHFSFIQNKIVNNNNVFILILYYNMKIITIFSILTLEKGKIFPPIKIALALRRKGEISFFRFLTRKTFFEPPNNR